MIPHYGRSFKILSENSFLKRTNMIQYVKKVIFGLTMVKKYLVKVLCNSIFADLEGKNET